MTKTKTKTNSCLLISEQEKGMIRINKNLQKSAKNIIRNLFRKKGLRVIITLHSQLYTKSITPLIHPLHPSEEVASPVFIGVSHPYTLKTKKSYTTNIKKTSCSRNEGRTLLFLMQ